MRLHRLESPSKEQLAERQARRDQRTPRRVVQHTDGGAATAALERLGRRRSWKTSCRPNTAGGCRISRRGSGGGGAGGDLRRHPPPTTSRALQEALPDRPLLNTCICTLHTLFHTDTLHTISHKPHMMLVRVSCELARTSLDVDTLDTLSRKTSLDG